MAPKIFARKHFVFKPAKKKREKGKKGNSRVCNRHNTKRVFLAFFLKFIKNMSVSVMQYVP